MKKIKPLSLAGIFLLLCLSGCAKENVEGEENCIDCKATDPDDEESCLTCKAKNVRGIVVIEQVVCNVSDERSFRDQNSRFIVHCE